MGLDDRYSYIKLFNNTLNCEKIYLSEDYKIESFLSKIMRGEIKDFSLSGLFSSTSEYIVDAGIIPFRASDFSSQINETSGVSIGKKAIQYPEFKTWVNETWKPILMFSQMIQPRYHNFLDYSPYTQIYLYIPYFPIIKLEPDKIYGNTIFCYVSLDIRNGQFTYYLYLNDTDLISTATVNVAIKIPFGKTNSEEITRNKMLSWLGITRDSLGIVGGIASQNPMVTMGSTALFGKDVMSLYTRNVDHLSGYSGMNGDINSLLVNKRVRMIRITPRVVMEPDKHVVGKPLEQYLSLDGLRGFTKVGDINFNPLNDSSITSEEIESIVSQLKSGVIL